MRRKSTTTGLIVKASFVLQQTVGVLYDPEKETSSLASGTAARRVASLRTSMSSSRSDLVIVPSLFVDETRLETMSASQRWHHIKSFPEHDGSSHTPPARVSRRHRTPDGWVHDGRSQLGGWVRWLSDMPTSSSPQSRSGNMDTTMNYPPLPGIVHVECDRDMLPPLARLGAWSRASLPSAPGPSCLWAAGWLGFLGGLTFLGA